MYTQIFQKILLPFHEKVIKRRKILDYRKFLEESQWWSKEKLLDYQWKELEKLLKHAYEQTPYWTETFKRRGLTNVDIKSYFDFQKLPITTKDDIRANKSQMIAKNYIGKTWTKATGGSTGVPLQLDYTSDSYDWRVAISKRGYGWAGCEDGMKQAMIWGVDIGNPPLFKKIKSDLHRRVLNIRLFNSFKFDEKEMAKCLNELNRFKPEIIVGYTNPLYNFARFVRDNGPVKFRPRAIISAAEGIHDFQKKEIQEVFQCGVFNTYGSREFMLIAAECKDHKGLHLSIENLFMEIIKDDGIPAKPGEMGNIIITDLHNYGMPFIRYQIGDMAVAPREPECSCGRGLPLVESIVGRSLDIIRTSEGRAIPGEFFPHLMKEFRWVKQFQIVQDKIDAVQVKIIKTDGFKDAEFNFMKAEIKNLAGEKMAVEYIFVDDIPLTKTGKFRVTVSNLNK